MCFVIFFVGEKTETKFFERNLYDCRLPGRTGNYHRSFFRWNDNTDDNFCIGFAVCCGCPRLSQGKLALSYMFQVLSKHLSLLLAKDCWC